MSREKVAIIGSGPSALVCISELKNKVSEITVFSPTGYSSADTGDEGQSFTLVRKDRFEKKEVYSKFLHSLQIKQDGTNFIESHTIGGLSEIWGGICLPQHYSERARELCPESEYIEILKDICNELSITGSTGEVWEFFTTNATSRNSILGKPPIALKNSEIWSSREKINQLHANGLELISSEVLKIEVKGENNVVTFHQDGAIAVREFDRIFVACGPIGDAKLILNSFPQIRKIEIADSATEYKVLFKFNFTTKFKKKMRPDFVGAILGSDNKIETYLQIYPISRQLLRSLPFEKMQFVIRPFFILVSKFISIGMIFRGSSNSNSFVIAKTEDGFISMPTKNLTKNKRVNRKISTLILKFGYLNTPFKIMNKPGTGIHSGAFIPSLNFNYGRLAELGIDAQKIHFVGASSLLVLPTGPITVSAMANSIYITRKTIKDLMA